MASSGKREFENKFSDYGGSSKLLNTASGKVEEPFYTQLSQQILQLLARYEHGLESIRDDYDYSVYTGTGGNAMLYMHLACTVFKDDQTKREQYFHYALELLEMAVHNLRGRRSTFLCGDAGVLALLAVLNSKLGKPDKITYYINKLQSMKDRVCKDQTLPDELLYGKAGYLYSLLYIQRELGQDKIDINIIDQICSSILSSGQRLAQQQRHFSSPLMYTWHNKYYVGAAHGIVGILYMLLQAHTCAAVQAKLGAIEACVEFLLSQQFPSGNFHSSLENSADKLIHWCHGAPGAIHLMIKAYKIWGKEKYLSAAIKCGEVIWRRGILRKGYGLCHGVAGNGYALLALYKATNEPRHLHRAIKFAEWCFDYGKHGCPTPDTPFSLFEGMAGTVYFLADLLQPGSSLFPAYEFSV